MAGPWRALTGEVGLNDAEAAPMRVWVSMRTTGNKLEQQRPGVGGERPRQDAGEADQCSPDQTRKAAIPGLSIRGTLGSRYVGLDMGAS